jgi:hypothetical protein
MDNRRRKFNKLNKIKQKIESFGGIRKYIEICSGKTNDEYVKKGILNLFTYIEEDLNKVEFCFEEDYEEEILPFMIGRLKKENNKDSYYLYGICYDGRQWWGDDWDTKYPSYINRIKKQNVLEIFLAEAADKMVEGSLSHRTEIDKVMFAY